MKLLYIVLHIPITVSNLHKPELVFDKQRTEGMLTNFALLFEYQLLFGYGDK